MAGDPRTGRVAQGLARREGAAQEGAGGGMLSQAEFARAELVLGPGLGGPISQGNGRPQLEFEHLLPRPPAAAQGEGILRRRPSRRTSRHRLAPPAHLRRNRRTSASSAIRRWSPRA